MSWSNPNFVDLAADAGTGVIKLRPNMLKYAEDPVILHELLHAYHAKLMGGGLENLGIKAMYAQAVSKNVFPQGRIRDDEPAGILCGDCERFPGR